MQSTGAAGLTDGADGTLALIYLPVGCVFSCDNFSHVGSAVLGCERGTDWLTMLLVFVNHEVIRLYDYSPTAAAATAAATV